MDLPVVNVIPSSDSEWETPVEVKTEQPTRRLRPSAASNSVYEPPVDDVAPPTAEDDDDKTDKGDEYPWAMWNLIYTEVQLEEHPSIIHEMCVKFQDNYILHAWQLKQAPKAWIQRLFPMETHIRHQLGVLHVQEILRQKEAANSNGNNTLAEAMQAVANETRKHAGRRNANELPRRVQSEEPSLTPRRVSKLTPCTRFRSAIWFRSTSLKALPNAPPQASDTSTTTLCLGPSPNTTLKA